MPRSYSFEHFTLRPNVSRRLARKDKAAYAATRGQPPVKGLEFGHAHAETQEILQARQMNEELQHLAGVEPAAAESEAELSGKLPLLGAPIGALPVASPPLPQRLRDIYDDARRSVSAMWNALGEFASAGTRLVEDGKELTRFLIRSVVPREA